MERLATALLLSVPKKLDGRVCPVGFALEEAFEIAVKESGAGAVMCSYNLLNGDYACENSYLLNDVLKKDFGFQGVVVSDWGATHSTAKAANAGLDMEEDRRETCRFGGRFASSKDSRIMKS